VHVSEDAADRLHAAAAAGDIDGVRASLAAGAALDARGEFGDSALNIACERGHADVVAFLLGEGADIENLGGADKTPLMNAAFAGNAGLARMLAAAGAKVSDDLLNSLAIKVSILEENAEAGMVRPEAVDAWRGFLDELIAARREQDSAAQ
jgi:ankyrin repeat protein